MAENLDKDSINGAQPDSNTQDPVSIVEEIERALSDVGAGAETKDENTFDLPLSIALGLLPEQYRRQVPPEAIAGERIPVSVQDLFKRLAGGKLQVTVAELAYFIPLHLIYHAALEDKSVITLPLPDVVNAIGLEEFRKRTPRKIRFYDITALPDPFEERQIERAAVEGIIIQDEEPTAQTPPTSPAAQAATEEAPAEAPKPVSQPAASSEQAPAAESLPPPAPAGPEAPQKLPATPPPPPVETGATAIRYPAADLLSRMPPELLAPAGAGAESAAEVLIEIPDLYDQLRTGRVELTVSRAARALGPGRVLTKALQRHRSFIRLDLALVVRSVDAKEFISRTPTASRRLDISRIPDPFPEPSVLPSLDEAMKQPRPPQPSVKETPAEIEVETAGATRAQILAPRVQEQGAQLDFIEYPNNVNINAASAEDLLVLPGVDKALAEAIVSRREACGGFKSIFDLAAVPGMDAAKFRRMTGMTLSPKRIHRRDRLARLLKLPPEQACMLGAIAGAIASRPGCLGCLISDWDGMAVARSGSRAPYEDLAAVLPAILRNIQAGLDLVDAGQIASATLSLKEHFLTATASRSVILTAAHALNSLSETEIEFLMKVNRELAWLLSVRAYAGPYVPDEVSKG